MFILNIKIDLNNTKVYSIRKITTYLLIISYKFNKFILIFIVKKLNIIILLSFVLLLLINKYEKK